MRRRSKVKKSTSRKMFKKTATRMNKRNRLTGQMRGGIRF